MTPQSSSMMEASPEPVVHVVYDNRTGEIVHTHYTYVIPGAVAPAERAMEARAIELAGHATGKTSARLAALSVKDKDLEIGFDYSVDLKSATLRKAPLRKAPLRKSTPRRAAIKARSARRPKR